MISSILEIGIKSLDHLAASAARKRQVGARHSPLSAYPRLQSLLSDAERNGLLADERRRLMQRRYSA